MPYNTLRIQCWQHKDCSKSKAYMLNANLELKTFAYTSLASMSVCGLKQIQDSL